MRERKQLFRQKAHFDKRGDESFYGNTEIKEGWDGSVEGDKKGL